MHILLVSHHAPPHIGGLENLVELEARALIEAGHEVTWLTTMPHPRTVTAPPPPLEESPVRIHRAPAWHGIERWANLAFPLPGPGFHTLARRLAAEAELVHVHGFVFATTVLAALACPRSTPLLLTDHGGILRYRSRIATLGLRATIETVGRWVTRRSTRAIAYNSEVESLLVRLAGGRPGRVAFVPNPVDTSVFHPGSVRHRADLRERLGWDPTPRIVFVGRLVDDKGIHILADAADPAYRLVFVGPGDEATVAKLSRVGQVLPPRPQRDLVDLYRAADVLALPSWNEGFPVVIQEALCCGCPVVTSDTPAYARYRALRGLHMIPPAADVLRRTLLERIGQPADREAIARSASRFFPDRREWVQALLSPAEPSTAPAAPGGAN